jgi:hypothetical protein
MTLCIVCPSRGPDDPGHDPDYERGFQNCTRSWGRMAAALHQIPALVGEAAGLGYVQRDGRTPVGGLVYPKGHALAGEQVPHFDQVSSVLPSGPLNGSRTAPRVSGSGEPSTPIRLDVTDLLMPARRASLFIGGQDQIGHLSVATELEFWVTDWADVRREGRPLPLVPDLCRWLLDRLDDACKSYPALDEFAAAVTGIHRTLLGVNGLYAARPHVMDRECPRCDLVGALTLEPDSRYIVCHACGTAMTEDDYAEYLRGLIKENPS